MKTTADNKSVSWLILSSLFFSPSDLMYEGFERDPESTEENPEYDEMIASPTHITHKSDLSCI